jgi:rubrerythrin
MKISDYFVSDKETKDIEYQEALILAMKREKAAFKLYKKLSKMTTDNELKEFFLQLANEEAKHKMNFEIEYDNIIYKNN